MLAQGALGLAATTIAAGIVLVGLAAPRGAVDALIPGGAVDGRAFLVLAGALTVLLALAGMMSAVALAHGHRFFPALAPALPSTVSAAYLVIAGQPTATSTLAAVAIGALLQCLLAAGLAVVPRPRIVRITAANTLSATWTFLLLFGLNLLPPLQRIVASAFDTPGAAHTTTPHAASKSFFNCWSAVLLWRALQIGRAEDVPAAYEKGSAALRPPQECSSSRPANHRRLGSSLVAAVLQRGAFDEADTLAVSTLLVILIPRIRRRGAYDRAHPLSGSRGELHTHLPAPSTSVD